MINTIPIAFQLRALDAELSLLQGEEESAARAILAARQRCEAELESFDWKPSKALLNAVDDLKAAEARHLGASEALRLNHEKRAELRKAAVTHA